MHPSINCSSDWLWIDYLYVSFVPPVIIEIYCYFNIQYNSLWPLLSTDRHIFEMLLISTLYNTHYRACTGLLLWVVWFDHPIKLTSFQYWTDTILLKMSLSYTTLPKCFFHYLDDIYMQVFHCYSE